MPCLTPFSLKRDKLKRTPIMLPCGKCPECKTRRITGWSFRIMQEELKSTSAKFITLTYDSRHIPISENHYLTLKKRDLQLFFKRLRKLNNEQIKYYAAGEYGENTKRPHYHIILFNCDNNTIQSAWMLGSVHYGTVTNASVAYNLKYIQKLQKNKMAQGDDREPEFSVMSKKLGVGYLTTQMIAWHKADLLNRMYINIPDGKKIAMPRYMKDKIYTESERKKIAATAKFKLEKQIREFENDSNFNKNFTDRETRILGTFERQHYLTTQKTKL